METHIQSIRRPPNGIAPLGLLLTLLLCLSLFLNFFFFHSFFTTRRDHAPPPHPSSTPDSRLSAQPSPRPSRLTNNALIWATALGVLALACAGFALHHRQVRRLRNLQLTQQHQALQDERTRIANEMHDDLGASLTQISLLSELALRAIPKPHPSEIQLQKIRETATEVFRRMDEMIWAVNPKHDSLMSLVDYLCRYSEQFLRLAQIRCRQDIPEEIPARFVPSDVRHHVWLIVKESLHNIVKHASATEVCLRVFLRGGNFEIQIEDNGKGFNPDSSKTGRHGLGNMQTRAQKAHATLLIKSQPARGAQLTLTVPFNLVQSAPQIRPSQSQAPPNTSHEVPPLPIPQPHPRFPRG